MKTKDKTSFFNKLVILCLCWLSLPACDWKDRESTAQWENPGDSLAEFDNRTMTPTEEVPAQAVREFEGKMEENSKEFAKRMSNLKETLSNAKPEEQAQMQPVIAELERKVAEFERQFDKLKKSEGLIWRDYRNIIMGSSYDIRQHFNRAEELIDRV